MNDLIAVVPKLIVTFPRPELAPRSLVLTMPLTTWFRPVPLRVLFALVVMVGAISAPSIPTALMERKLILVSVAAGVREIDVEHGERNICDARAYWAEKSTVTVMTWL